METNYKVVRKVWILKLTGNILGQNINKKKSQLA